IPQEADTDRTADERCAVKADLKSFAGHIPKRWALVIPQITCVRKSSDLDANVFWQEVKRCLRFDTCAPKEAAAKSVIRRPRSQVARTYTGGGETAYQIRTHLELIKHTQLLAAPWGNIAGLHFKYANDVGENFVVGSRFNGRAEELHVAADAREILPQFGVETAGRQFVVVQRIVGGRGADHRNGHGALRQFLADGK